MLANELGKIIRSVVKTLDLVGSEVMQLRWGHYGVTTNATHFKEVILIDFVEKLEVGNVWKQIAFDHQIQ